MTTTTARLSILAALLVGGLLASGCSDNASRVLGGDGTGGTGVGTEAAAEFGKTIADAAVETDSMTQQAMAADTATMQGDPWLSEVGRPSPTNIERTISRTMPCPAGGEINVEGMLAGTFDRESRTLEINGSGAREAVECSFARNDRTVTIDGTSNWEWMRRFVNGMPDGLQSRRYFGSWVAVGNDGMSRSCTFDYTVSYDPMTRTTTVTGQMCDSPLTPREPWKVDF